MFISSGKFATDYWQFSGDNSTTNLYDLSTYLNINKFLIFVDWREVFIFQISLNTL